MRVLLDNCVSRRVMLNILVEHEVDHAGQVGMATLSNGRLLAAAADAGYGCVLTVDRNLRHQQHLPSLPLPLVFVELPNNTAPFLLLIEGAIREAVMVASTSRFVVVDERCVLHAR